MLLKPQRIDKQQNVPAGSVQAQDPFDAPVPGQSLTEEPGKHPWDKPPEIVDVDEAMGYVIENIMESPEATEQLGKQLMTGLPIESLVNTITFTGFAEGKWTPDIAELMKPPLSAFFILFAQEHNIPAVMFNTGDEEGLSDDHAMLSMREGNPEAFEHLQNQAAIENASRAEQIPEGFLDMPPEEQPMIEEQPVNEEGGMV